MEHAPWWADSRLRLGSAARRPGTGGAGSALGKDRTLQPREWLSASTRGGVRPWMSRPGAPEVKSVPGADLAALRNTVTRIMPPRVGRVYEAGTITTSNLWSDDHPQRSSSSGSQAGSVPAGYEVRWWALDREGNEDDVVADVLEFATERQAEDALSRAASTRCRQRWRGACGALSLRRQQPLSGSIPTTPSSGTCCSHAAAVCTASEMFRRTILLQRDRPSAALERLRALTAPWKCWPAPCLTLLARRLPSPLAPPTWRPFRPTRRFSPAPVAPITRAHASTYAHAVNLRGYDVPEMTQVAPEGPIEDRGSWEAFVRCTGELRSAHTVVSIHSPIFTYSDRLRFQSAYSSVAILPSERAADRYLAVLASARARACITHNYRRLLLDRTAERKPLRLGQIAAAPLPASAPTSYRGLGPYRGTALRLTIQSIYTTRRGRHVQLPFYFEDFVFAYGRAVIGLSAESSLRPFMQANEQYLMSRACGASRGQ